MRVSAEPCFKGATLSPQGRAEERSDKNGDEQGMVGWRLQKVPRQMYGVEHTTKGEHRRSLFE